MGSVLSGYFVDIIFFKYGNMQVPSQRGLDWCIEPETDKLVKVYELKKKDVGNLCNSWKTHKDPPLGQASEYGLVVPAV